MQRSVGVSVHEDKACTAPVVFYAVKLVSNGYSVLHALVKGVKVYEPHEIFFFTSRLVHYALLHDIVNGLAGVSLVSADGIRNVLPAMDFRKAVFVQVNLMQ